ncbi:nuclear transport factor 2 family protein [Fodinicola feengrottensis]|uniref:DUF4440 domain-containing protein n=1 Tax=Fodinicola feengrottensis TaxID=435914 RepID=A0ABP4V5I8_9ACTN|nr:nuclear transport factor 2 family protein [Fodinicola feengrottensis]
MDGEQELRAAERRLQRAQLARDVEVLDQLLDERLIFTYGGECFGKQDDLDLQKSGQQLLTKVQEEDLTVLVEGRAGVTWLLAWMEGTVGGEPFAAQLRYTRTWFRDDRLGWRVVAAHFTQVPAKTAP